MKRAMLAALFAAVLAAAPSVASAGYSISVNPASPTITSGVYFTVTTGGGNRDFTSVAVNCSDDLAGNNVIYSTVLTVIVPPKGTADSQKIYPPASFCVAKLEKLMQIGKAHELATVKFTVS